MNNDCIVYTREVPQDITYYTGVLKDHQNGSV